MIKKEVNAPFKIIKFYCKPKIGAQTTRNSPRAEILFRAWLIILKIFKYKLHYSHNSCDKNRGKKVNIYTSTLLLAFFFYFEKLLSTSANSCFECDVSFCYLHTSLSWGIILRHFIKRGYFSLFFGNFITAVWCIKSTGSINIMNPTKIKTNTIL